MEKTLPFAAHFPGEAEIARVRCKTHPPNTDVPPNISGAAEPENAKWVWTLDLASARAAKVAYQFLRTEKVARPSWMPRGAGCHPLDISALKSMKEELKRALEADRGSLPKLR